MAFVATIPPSRATGETRDVYRYMQEVGGAGTVAQIIQLFSLRPASMRWAIRSLELAMWRAASRARGASSSPRRSRP